MELDIAKTLITDSTRLGKKLIHITGGKIFLYYSDLLSLVEHIRSLYGISNVETNGYWQHQTGILLEA